MNRTHYITVSRDDSGAVFVCQDCDETIVTGPDVWVPEHECPVRDGAA